jgi:Phage tail tube protein, GTA-gp10
MANRTRGEAALAAGDKTYRLLLTLGALAEIEDGLGLADLSEVSSRLKTVRAADLAVVVAALLRGGGHDLQPTDVLRLPCDLGALVAAMTDAFDAAGLAGDPARSSSEAVARGADNRGADSRPLDGTT